MKRLLVILLVFSSSAFAAEWSGYVAGELRLFPEDAAFPGQHDTFSSSLVLQPEFYHEWAKGDQSLLVTPYARLDQEDDERSHFDLRELIWRRTSDRWELKAGVGKVFWGVTESAHLVDIINQTDGVEDLDGEDKLGQPMLHLSLFPDAGTLELFVLPYFRERTFAGVDGRLRPGVVVNTDKALYESSAGEEHVDAAIRWSQIVGDFDIGLSHFYGTAREPVLSPSFHSAELVPFYPIIHQSGLDLQFTREGWLWKLETIYQDSDVDAYLAFAGGFEYTFVGVFGSVADLGVLTEYLRDERKAPTPFEDDIFLGARLALNDVQSTELLAGVVQDLDEDARFFNLEASRRLGDRYKLSVQARLFTDIPQTDPLASLADDDYVQLELARYF